MLGRDLVEVLQTSGAQLVPLTRADLDITSPASVDSALAQTLRPSDLVVNCAAWTAVDDAEQREAEAFAVNATGAQLLARACARAGAGMVQVSTDYVFDGTAEKPYPASTPMAPRSAYGRTKAAGEWAVRAELPDRHWILRTAWLYGAHGPNFVATMARLEREREFIDVVDDQHGQPTWTQDLARQIVALADAGAPAGAYHACSSGSTTWHGLAQAIFAELGADPARVRPTTSAAFVRPAPRPAFSVLDQSGWAAIGLEPIRPWDDALRAAIPQLGLR
jgi:dTDP-4-dehydrorhamnose reductase